MSAVDRQMPSTIVVIGRSGVTRGDTGVPCRPKNFELIVTNVRRFPAWRRTMKGEVGVSTPPLRREMTFSRSICSW